MFYDEVAAEEVASEVRDIPAELDESGSGDVEVAEVAEAAPEAE